MGRADRFGVGAEGIKTRLDLQSSHKAQSPSTPFKRKKKGGGICKKQMSGFAFECGADQRSLALVLGVLIGVLGDAGESVR